MIRIAVCDDDAAFLEGTVRMIERWSDAADVCAKVLAFNDGDALLCDSGHNDIVFLDIIMPLVDGMDTAREIRARDTATRIIFLTSSPEFALESYSVRAHNYLLKPISYEKLCKTLDECVEYFEKDSKHVIIKTGSGYRKVYCRNIEYVEAQNKHVCICLDTGEQVVTMQTLHTVEDMLAGDEFFRCHRSYIVNMTAIDSFGTAAVTTRSGHTVPIARGIAKPFKEAYFALMFNN